MTQENSPNLIQLMHACTEQLSSDHFIGARFRSEGNGKEQTYVIRDARPSSAGQSTDEVLVSVEGSENGIWRPIPGHKIFNGVEWEFTDSLRAAGQAARRAYAEKASIDGKALRAELEREKNAATEARLREERERANRMRGEVAGPRLKAAYEIVFSVGNDACLNHPDLNWNQIAGDLLAFGEGLCRNGDAGGLEMLTTVSCHQSASTPQKTWVRDILKRFGGRPSNTGRREG